MLKKKNFITLQNGNKYEFTFSATTKKFVNLRQFFRSKYCKSGDTLLFQLSAKTEFAVSIFGKRNVECILPDLPSVPGMFVMVCI